MDAAPASVLLIGYGNPGRLDDGLGPALAEAVAALNLPHVTVEADYQLQVEHAAQIAAHDAVIFADADLACDEPFRFEPVWPVRQASFTSHSLSPQALYVMIPILGSARPVGNSYLLRNPRNNPPCNITDW